MAEAAWRCQVGGQVLAGAERLWAPSAAGSGSRGGVFVWRWMLLSSSYLGPLGS